MTIKTFKGVQNQELVLKSDYDNAERDAQIGAELSERLARQLQEKQSDYDKLAAENCIQDFIIAAVKDLVRDSDGVMGWHLNGDVASWDEVLPELSHSETPATDAAIAKIKALGVKEFGEFWQKNCDGESFIAAEARKYAANLRAGVGS